jgi:hypothetical protein
MTGWSIPLAVLYRAAGRDVYYVHAEGVVQKPWVRDALADAGICVFDFMRYDNIDPTHAMGLRADFAAHVLAAIPDATVANLVILFRQGCAAPQQVTAHKLLICIYYELLRQVAATAEIEAIATLLRRTYSSVSAYLPVASDASFAFLHGELNFTRGRLSTLRNIAESMRRLGQIAVAVLRSLILRRARAPLEADGAGTVQPERARVLYFPHQGILYGQLFRRDFLYESATDSPLHPSRVLHVEITTPLGSGVVDQYVQSGVPWRLLLPTGRRLQSCKAFLFQFVSARMWRQLSPRVAMLAFLVGFAIFRRYRAYLAAIDFEPGAVAVIGYEMLFPRVLALALQASGIRIVAVQERMQTAYMKDFNLILDRFLVAGPAVAERVGKAKFASIGHVDCVGMLRADLLLASSRKGRRPLVLVLDYISPLNWWENTSPLTNQEANKAFYLDILHLALDRPAIDFVLRGKNDEWLAHSFFQDIAAIIDRTPNLVVDRTYSELNRSYRLAVEADCVVAKYTSLGDECLAAGKPVIYHDWSKNSIGYAKSFYDYAGLPVFAHDYAGLLKMLDSALAGAQQMSDGPGLLGIDAVFVRPTPGHSVGERARAIIKECLAPLPTAAPGVRVAAEAH